MEVGTEGTLDRHTGLRHKVQSWHAYLELHVLDDAGELGACLVLMPFAVPVMAQQSPDRHVCFDQAQLPARVHSK